MLNARASARSALLGCAALALGGCHRDRDRAPQAGASTRLPLSAPLPVTRPAPTPKAGGIAGEKAAKRATCAFRAGATPRETLDATDPIGRNIPIDHFVVVLQENRSFDHYFQKLPAFGQPDVDVAPDTFENADPSDEGELVHPFLLDDPCLPDVPHNWIAVQHQLGDGKMGGFLTSGNPGGRRSLGYYDQSTLGYYYALANTFAIGDRYFASVPGPTFPNRMFFLSASSFGHAKNTPPPARDEERTLLHQLEEKGITWTVYAESGTFEEDIYPRLRQEKGEHFRPVSEFYTDAQAGRLPFFSWIESAYEGERATDEHAPANVQLGQAFVARVVATVMNSSNWSSSALFLTYDEHGGFFDHVTPPAACPPDDSPVRMKGIAGDARFDHLGVRVPFVVVSPFAKAHFVSHRVHAHTSVLRLVQARAELPALTDRDANDDPPYEFFDFDRPPFLIPPSLPAAVVNPIQEKRCVEVARAALAEKKKNAQKSTAPRAD